jgi:hypothetical protein
MVTRDDWRPTLDDVAAHLPARFRAGTVDPGAPLARRIRQLAESLQRDVAVALDGDPVLPDDVAYARDTVALGVAAYVENEAFPEQNDSLTTGTGEFLRRRYQEHLAVLQARLGVLPIA